VLLEIVDVHFPEEVSITHAVGLKLRS
jgi:hypothetical protein